MSEDLVELPELGVRVDVHLDRNTFRETLRREALEGLTGAPKSLAPKWFYDERGCALFEEITRLPEYYPTRCEREILEERAGEVAHLSAADTIVELGSGSSEKTRLLLDAFTEAGCLRRFVPFDVSEAAVRASAPDIAADYPDLEVHGVVGDFDHHLDTIPDGGRRLVVFLGGTIGNFPPTERAEFLSRLTRDLNPGDALLMGTDLVKDVERLEAAYDDPRGVTAAFNRNVLEVLNRELEADFDPDMYDHVAAFDPAEKWIEMRLRARSSQRISLRAVGVEITFEQGEDVQTEISAKFRREQVESELTRAGLRPGPWWTDANGDFALSLSHVA